MTVRLSPQKVSRMLKLFFKGMAQLDIARKVGADQSTVSLYASRFRLRADEVGLPAAGKEFGVFNEVSVLRSLSIELTQVGLTVEEAKEGLKIIKIFINYGINPEQHSALVKACEAVHNPGFVQAAVKLTRIEAETGMSYEEATSRFETAASNLSSTENKLKKMRIQLESLDKTVAQEKQEAAGLQSYIGQLQKEAENKEARLEQGLAAKMKQLAVKQAQVEELATLKKQLAKDGLDIPTLVKLAKEYANGSK